MCTGLIAPIARGDVEEKAFLCIAIVPCKPTLLSPTALGVVFWHMPTHALTFFFIFFKRKKKGLTTDEKQY